MLMSIITTELAKLALNKMSELKMDDALKAIETLRRSTGRSGALLVPGLGALGVGLAVGTGIGMLMAPRSGADTRAALRDSLRGKLGALRTKLGYDGLAAEEVEAREPNGQSATSNEPRSASN
jgi:hypothetical protein